MTVIAQLVLDDDPKAWEALGFVVDDAGRSRVGTVELRFESGGATGIQRWTLAGAPEALGVDVDGLATSAGEAPSGPRPPHPIGAERIDHVVVTTPDLDRTIDAVTDVLALPLRRVREANADRGSIRQAFFRMGEVILEVVGPAEPDATACPARFYGLAIIVADLDAVCQRLGTTMISEQRAAVQPGRRIATVRPAAGLRTALALMTP